MISAKKRKFVNFEFMRIISMLMIIVWHIIVHGGFDGIIDGYGKVFDVILSIIIVHVNSFILLMGYFQYKNKFKFNKVLGLLGVSWFYRIFIILLFIFVFKETLTAGFLFLSLVPIDMNDNYWFINVYVLVYALSPFFNILIKKMSQKQHFCLLTIFFFCFSFLPLVSGDSIFNNDGYAPIQMIFMYFVGAYLGKYDFLNKGMFSKFSKNKKILVCVIFFFVCVILNLGLIKIGTIMQSVDGSILQILGNFIVAVRLNYGNPFVIFQTISYFMIFKNLTFKEGKLSNLILKISPHCLGVYLITENLLIKKYMYKFLNLNATNFTYNINFFMWMFVMTICIFAVCILCEMARSFIFKNIKKISLFSKLKFKFNKFTKHVDEVLQ